MASDVERPKRLVTLQRDGDDFVVTFYPEDIVVFRHTEPQPLRKMCAIYHRPRIRLTIRQRSLVLEQWPASTS